jgi:hypothetical protein
MSEQLELKRVEYRVRPVTRFIVTCCEEWNLPEGSPNGQTPERRVVERGEFDNPDMAWEVGYALAKQRHELIGWPVGDDRIQYPQHPRAANAEPAKPHDGHHPDCAFRDGKRCDCGVVDSSDFQRRTLGVGLSVA